MAGINKVILVGHLGKDPEVKTFESSNKNVKFSLATSETFKGKDGVRQDRTEWHNIVMWGNQAEVAEKYLRKGNMIYLEGKIRTRKYTDSNNVERSITEIVVDNFTMLGGKKGPDEDGNFDPERPTAIKSEPETGLTAGTEDDLPF